MKHQNFNHLFSFYTVARSGSLKNASLNLGVSQSTLSEQIKLLEERSGCPLFTRAGRTLSLNAHGRMLLEKIGDFFEREQSLLDFGRAGPSAVSRVVDVGITTTISKPYAYELLRPLFLDPGTVVRLTESTADHLLSEFKQQSIEILITHERLRPTFLRRLKAIPLREPSLVVLGSKPFRRLSSEFPKSLSGAPFFLFTQRTPLRWEIEKFFRSHNILPNVRGEADDVELLKSAALEGLGLTILARRSVSHELRSKKLHELAPLPKSDIRVYAYYLGGDLDAGTRRVVELLESLG